MTLLAALWGHAQIVAVVLAGLAVTGGVAWAMFWSGKIMSAASIAFAGLVIFGGGGMLTWRLQDANEELAEIRPALVLCKENILTLTGAINQQNERIARLKTAGDQAREAAEKRVTAAQAGRRAAEKRAAAILASEPGKEACRAATELLP